MSLHLIASPIGDPQDISLRALALLRDAEVIIGEERREVSTLLKRHEITGKQIELLNEHSTDEDVSELLKLCRTMRVALVSDCGTPGFCDPGARLVAACRKEGLTSSPVPGASSLMCLLSMAGQAMNQFVFRGFLPVDKEERRQALSELAGESRPVILMDTPYRLSRLLSELAALWPERRALIGCNFTQPNERVVESTVQDLAVKFGDEKAEFILALFPLATRAPLQAGPGRPLRTASVQPGRKSGAHRPGPRSGVRDRKDPRRR